ncbi:MAG TPA: hypothetical protein VFI95_09755 [Terriglobales bacterium]|nr:hypothetical protein [Terriglobales bacterium]
MTLAFVLLFSAFGWTAPAVWPLQSQSAAEPAEPATESAPDKPQGNGNPQTSAPPETKPSAQTPSNSTTPATTKRKRHKKKAKLSNCGVRPTPPVEKSTNPHGATPGDPSAGTASARAPGQNSVAPDPKDCPPPKTIVRHGGTSEPSIQLAGGPNDSQASHKRDVVNQLLGVTENNLKKAAGKQLNSTQQDTLSQARAFMQQSRTAIADGDLDRARTLAWKAETLSEDLIKP